MMPEYAAALAATRDICGRPPLPSIDGRSLIVSVTDPGDDEEAADEIIADLRDSLPGWQVDWTGDASGDEADIMLTPPAADAAGPGIGYPDRAAAEAESRRLRAAARAYEIEDGSWAAAADDTIDGTGARRHWGGLRDGSIVEVERTEQGTWRVVP